MVTLHLLATVDVADGEVAGVKQRLQEALERVTDPLLEMGAEVAPDIELSVKVRATEARGEGVAG